MSINNFNAKSFSDILEEERMDEIAHNGLLYPYLAMLIYRLRALFLKDPKKKDSVVLVTCFINEIMYKKDIITSVDQRLKGIPFSSNTIPENLRSYNNSKNKVNTVLICNGKPFQINLGTIHAGLEQHIVLYESFIRDQYKDAERKRQGGFMDALIKTADNTAVFENMVDTNFTCYTAFPEMDEVTFAVAGDRDDASINWFETHDRKKAERYRKEARKARMIYLELLEKVNANNMKKRMKRER